MLIVQLVATLLLLPIKNMNSNQKLYLEQNSMLCQKILEKHTPPDTALKYFYIDLNKSSHQELFNYANNETWM